MSKLTYADFSRTGYQDCASFELRDAYEAWRDLGKPHGPGAAKEIVLEVWGDDADQYKQWLKQADIDDIVDAGLDIQKAYKEWRYALQACAESLVKAALKDWIARDEENDHATIAKRRHAPGRTR